VEKKGEGCFLDDMQCTGELAVQAHEKVATLVTPEWKS
jgi:hypothetical protein